MKSLSACRVVENYIAIIPTLHLTFKKHDFNKCVIQLAKPQASIMFLFEFLHDTYNLICTYHGQWNLNIVEVSLKTNEIENV